VVTIFLDLEMLITENIDQMQTAFLDLEMLITENIDQMQTAFFDLEMLITENIDQMWTALFGLEMQMTEKHSPDVYSIFLLRSLNANFGQIFTLCKQEFAQQIAFQE
jgi:hypothetical protein